MVFIIFNEHGWGTAIRDVWHGTSLKAATNIAAIGFDLRLACAHGRLGKGIYIAEDGAVAHSYALGRSETDEVVVIRCRASLGTGTVCRGVCLWVCGSVGLTHVASHTECDSSTINSSMPKVGNHYAAPENTWWCVLEEAQVWPTHLIRYKTTNMRF